MAGKEIGALGNPTWDTARVLEGRCSVNSSNQGPFKGSQVGGPIQISGHFGKSWLKMQSKIVLEQQSSQQDINEKQDVVNAPYHIDQQHLIVSFCVPQSISTYWLSSEAVITSGRQPSVLSVQRLAEGEV